LERAPEPKKSYIHCNLCKNFETIYRNKRFLSFQVVQEYERAVIFRLGRLMQGGAKGPGNDQL
jgi:hypothetical protein